MWLIEFWQMWNWGGRIGLLVGLIGIIVGMAAVISVTPVTGLVITAVVIGVFYFIFKFIFYPEVESRRLQQYGEDAEATILKVIETGWTVNEIYYIVNFELEVRPKNGPAYQAKTRGMISRLTMAQFQAGAVVPVKVDPKDPQKVALVETTEASADTALPATPASAVISQDQIKEVEARLKERDALNRELLTSGESAEATILRSWEMGIFVNGDNPVMGFMLEVRPSGRPAFTAETEAPITKTSVYKYLAGKKVYIKFDPNDQTKVTLDHAVENK